MLSNKKNLFCQSPAQINDEIYDDGFLRVEHKSYYVECGGKHLKLGRSEFLIISLLSQRAGRYVRVESIWRYIWKGNRPFNPGSLKVFIYNLRRKLKPFGIKIETMAYVGYRIVPNSKTK